ncbi:unnamed protein product [Strongylus vulgaris]|uniref:C-type lectin domain-containing protein n=1 Tax=Strongylus vulgaris TaxID=40348 RepID=A0A3P7JRA7_STRVU|nr:unnamed protein product [Strongylus vulgaris]
MARKAGSLVWLGIKCPHSYRHHCIWDESQAHLQDYSVFFHDHSKSVPPRPVDVAEKYSRFLIELTPQFGQIGNPNSIGECVMMMIGELANGKWVSADCRYMRVAFVCQVARKKLCGDYREYAKGGKCYKRIHQRLSFDEAERYCQQECGHLASIHNAEENEIFHEMFDYKGDYGRLGLKQSNDNFSWTDNTTFDYNNFGVNNTKLGDCVAMSLADEIVNATQWINVPCDQGLPFVCQKVRGACFNTTTISEVPPPTMAPTTCDQPQFFDRNGTVIQLVP